MSRSVAEEGELIRGVSMKFRPQRGGYAESMAACVELETTYEALAKHLNVPVGDIRVDFYCHDTREDWGNTFVVTVGGDAVGFTSGGLCLRSLNKP